ncbi:MAG TPA: hypothetical protein VEA58_03235 [Anaerovoracaceae bacterium]|nr:hypothetical protein [Anaerovoracaceae bacterium]
MHLPTTFDPYVFIISLNPSLIQIMDLKTIVTNAGMSDRPGFYSGRGATTTDLNSVILNKIADQIQEHFGQSAHDSYVEMVWSMPSMSATAFLNNLYSLGRADWDLAKAEISNNGATFESEGEAFGLIMETMSQLKGNQKIDESEQIKSGFRRLTKSAK